MTRTPNIIKIYSQFLLLFIFSLIACSEMTRDSKSVKALPEKKKTNNSKPPSSFSDTLIINFPAAIFYSPDSLQLERIKAITDSSIFESSTHEYFYQMKYSRNLIQKSFTSLKIVEISNMRYLLFISNTGVEECVDLDTRNDFCGILLFDGYKKAKQADMTNIDTELGFYFSK